MTTRNDTAPAILPQDDTRHEGIQQAIEIALARQSALTEAFCAAVEARNSEHAAELGIRAAEVDGLIRALRGAA